MVVSNLSQGFDFVFVLFDLIFRFYFACVYVCLQFKLVFLRIEVYLCVPCGENEYAALVHNNKKKLFKSRPFPYLNI